ncbi:MAG TPA: alpha-amylase [Candidatus Avirikenella pullistercoris]|nr:alpha-amylase [Candidatus Avirikenella pullistercoris]
MIHPEWGYNAVIYEVNIRQYTPEGTFAAFEPHLSRLKDMGVTVLWFMPVCPIGKINRKGSLGSYYSISDYKAVNPEFGTMEEFKRLVAKAHEMGFKVLMDMVTNHTAWDHVWLKEGHREWYEQDERGNVVTPYDWTDTAKLDYKNAEMRRAMIDALEFWIREVGIDGYRQDMAGLVPLDFWEEAVPRLRSVNSELFMLGEVESPDYHRNNTFDATYAWEFGHLIERIARKEASVDGLRNLLNHDKTVFPYDAFRLLFTSNHDENSWSGSESERFGPAQECMAVLTYILNGIPLIYSGQEAGSAKRLAFFEKDLIDWSSLNDYTPFYKELNKLRRENPALRSGERGGEVIYFHSSQPYNVLAIKRKQGDNIVMGVFNLTPYEIQPAFWDEDYKGVYNKLFYGEQQLYPGQYDPFGPWEYKVYYK